MLAVCAERKVDDYTRFCTVLTADAESDFDAGAKHPTDDTWGVFQQNPRWWPTAREGTRAQTGAFLDHFRTISRTGREVDDCWQVQHWTLNDQPNPFTDRAAWLQLPNTVNYTRRMEKIRRVVATGRLP